MKVLKQIVNVPARDSICAGDIVVVNNSNECILVEIYARRSAITKLIEVCKTTELCTCFLQDKFNELTEKADSEHKTGEIQ